MQKFNFAVAMIVFSTLAITPKAEAINLLANQPIIASKVTVQTADTQNENDVSTYLEQGFQHLDEENYQEAIANFNQVLKLEPNNSDAYFGRGLVNFSLDNYQAAKDDLDKTLEITPNLAYGYYFRGVTRFILNDKPGAITDLRQASTLFTQEGELELAQKADNAIEEIQES
ncbi:MULTISPECIES: tetratricopeptide repeat protein [unclassified Nodularia (in: cyanobacteria)]|uniref:tetratricopeptide repeat protein n=1 Tax=unclassified Nodularia (in: cyanobacteria) TaxID=2656917 RepID=UPI00187E78F2|nr:MULTISPECIES: tetratricopeptide repeat protein [unclassified Nodularia (in: cyanobacteria)]MBE9198877.1 tetratricopeptide repeat protein [Nodularia sp. LEGE 06071]MCC2695415.1 tetratricopeptide repeat protein [Nodularia sp. LEGE 04288]